MTENPSYDPATNTISATDAYRTKQRLYKALNKAFDKDIQTGMADAQMNIAETLVNITGDVVPELRDILSKEGDNLNFIKYAKRRMEQLSGDHANRSILGFVIDSPKYIALRALTAPGFRSRLAIAIKNSRNGKILPAELTAKVEGVVEAMKAKLNQADEISVDGSFVKGPDSVSPTDFNRGARDAINSTTRDSLVKREQTIANPEELPGRQSSAMLNIPGSNALGLEEGGNRSVNSPTVFPEQTVLSGETLPPKGANVGDQLRSGSDMTLESGAIPRGGPVANPEGALPPLKPGTGEAQMAVIPMKPKDIVGMGLSGKMGSAGVAEAAMKLGVPVAVLSTWLLADDKKKRSLLQNPAYSVFRYD
jgi:hypothetical protein